MFVYLRYFKQKAVKESQRKRENSDSDDEMSEKETNFGNGLFLVSNTFLYTSLYILCFTDLTLFICSFGRQYSRRAV